MWRNCVLPLGSGRATQRKCTAWLQDLTVCHPGGVSKHHLGSLQKTYGYEVRAIVCKISMTTDGLALQIFLHDRLVGPVPHQSSVDKCRANLLKDRRERADVPANLSLVDLVCVPEILPSPFESQPPPLVDEFS